MLHNNMYIAIVVLLQGDYFVLMTIKKKFMNALITSDTCFSFCEFDIFYVIDLVSIRLMMQCISFL